jgi:hypothetical protein
MNSHLRDIIALNCYIWGETYDGTERGEQRQKEERTVKGNSPATGQAMLHEDLNYTAEKTAKMVACYVRLS